MKGWGIAFVVIGILNLISGIAAVAYGEAEAAGRKFGGAGMLIVLGAFMISRAKKKKEEEQNKSDWNNDEH